MQECNSCLTVSIFNSFLLISVGKPVPNKSAEVFLIIIRLFSVLRQSLSNSSLYLDTLFHTCSHTLDRRKGEFLQQASLPGKPLKLAFWPSSRQECRWFLDGYFTTLVVFHTGGKAGLPFPLQAELCFSVEGTEMEGGRRWLVEGPVPLFMWGGVRCCARALSHPEATAESSSCYWETS